METLENCEIACMLAKNWGMNKQKPRKNMAVKMYSDIVKGWMGWCLGMWSDAGFPAARLRGLNVNLVPAGCIE